MRFLAWYSLILLGITTIGIAINTVISDASALSKMNGLIVVVLYLPTVYYFLKETQNKSDQQKKDRNMKFLSWYTLILLAIFNISTFLTFLLLPANNIQDFLVVILYIPSIYYLWMRTVGFSKT